MHTARVNAPDVTISYDQIYVTKRVERRQNTTTLRSAQPVLQSLAHAAHPDPDRYAISCAQPLKLARTRDQMRNTSIRI